MRALPPPQLTPEATRELDRLYRTTRDLRLRTRAQIVLLAAEQSLVAAEIARIVRTDEQTVRRWLKRYQERGLNGLLDSRRPGGPRKVTDVYLDLLFNTAARSPSDLALPYVTWTTQRLTEFMVKRTGIRVNPETVRLHLRAAGVSLAASEPGQPTMKPNLRKGTGPSRSPAKR